MNLKHFESFFKFLSYDDIIHLALISFSLGFGYYYRTIKHKKYKKTLGTAVGIFILLVASGVHIIHFFITIFVNALIILYVNKKQCHLVSFVFSFFYLLFFLSAVYFGLPHPPELTNLAQRLLTLKLVGLAFEVNSGQIQENFKDEKDARKIELNFFDIFHYSFNYIGVITGPYYRYQTFEDYFDFPFAEHANWKKVTLDKFKFIPFFMGFLIWISHNWPTSYIATDEFYERSWLYRYWYILPTFWIFQMRVYIGLLFGECLCTMAGFGAYPTFTKPEPGHGPTKNFSDMKKLVFSEVNLSKTEYDFETIHNIDPYKSESCTTYREALKHWSICVQYWLSAHIYKRFPYKKFKTFVTFLISSFWHGINAGDYVCLSTMPLVFVLENVYYKLYLKDGKGRFLKLFKWAHWFLKKHFYSYQITAFQLLKFDLILRYYNSVYHAGLILGISLYLVGLILLKIKKKKVLEKTLKTE